MLKLKQYLEKHNLTHSDFAQKVGVTQATINRYVRGERSPSKKTIIKIKDATNGFVTVTDWYEGLDQAS